MAFKRSGVRLPLAPPAWEPRGSLKYLKTPGNPGVFLIPPSARIRKVEDGSFLLDDFFGNQVAAPRRLIDRLTLRKGETLQAPGRETEVLDVLNRANPRRNYGDR